MLLVLSLIRLITNLYLLLLFARLLLYDYRFYGGGPLTAVIDATTGWALRPVQLLIRRNERWAIGWTALVVVVLRGVVYGLLLITVGAGAGILGPSLQQSAMEFVWDLLRAVTIALFVGVALIRAGGYYSVPGVRLLEDWTAWALGLTRKVVVVANPWVAYALTLVWLTLIGAVLRGLITLEPAVVLLWIPMLLQILALPLWVLWLAILIYVILSWFSPDPYNLAYQLLETLARPPIDWARRLFPWARIDMLDLSPIIVFIMLSLAQLLLYQFAAGLAARLLGPGGFALVPGLDSL